MPLDMGLLVNVFGLQFFFFLVYHLLQIPMIHFAAADEDDSLVTADYMSIFLILGYDQVDAGSSLWE